jgi:hypothetical protein
VDSRGPAASADPGHHRRVRQVGQQAPFLLHYKRMYGCIPGWQLPMGCRTRALHRSCLAGLLTSLAGKSGLRITLAFSRQGPGTAAAAGEALRSGGPR